MSQTNDPEQPLDIVSEAFQAGAAVSSQVTDVLPERHRNYARHYAPLFEGRFQQMCAERAAHQKPGHKIAFQWHADASLNAIASIDGGDNVGVNIGSIIILDRYFELVVRNALKMDGSHPDQLAGAIVLDKSNDHYSQLVDLPRNDAVYENPNFDAVHWAFMRSSMDFILQHELGHIWRGHVDLINKEYGLGEISEIKLHDNYGIKPIDWQTLEMDADSFAIGETIKKAYFNPITPTFPKGLPLPNIEEQFGAGTSRIFHAIIGIYSIFKLFGESTWAMENIDTDGHPPASVRMYYNMGVVYENLRQFTNIPNPIHLVLQAIEAAESHYASVFGANSLIYAENLEDKAKYTNALLRNWRNLRPGLVALKRGGDLPAVQEIADDE